MVDLETASYFAVINWGEPYEDEYDGWSFKYTHTTAEYNGKNISDPLLERRYGGQGKYAPDMNEMEQYLIKIRVQEQDLSGKNFFNRDLSGQDFSHANLQDANLSRADLKYADLEGANLENAYLGGADFTGVDLTNANLEGIVIEEDTKIEIPEK